MPVEAGFRVVGRGPLGATIIDIDDQGIKDVANRYFTPWLEVTWPVTATMAASYIWRNYRGTWQVEDAEVDVSVQGGASAALDLMVCTGLVAPGSGVTQLTATMTLVGTAPFRTRGSLIASPTLIVPGDFLSVNIAGTMTGAVGMLNAILKRVAA